MKGVILTGGKGSRLRPFTYSGAKQLVPVGNIPVLHFPVKQLVACGVTEIALVVGDTEPQIRAAMGDGTAFGARFTYVRQDAPRGIAHGLGICRDFASGESVVLYLGDNVLLNGISGFVREFEDSLAAAAVILKSVDDPRAFGVGVITDGGLTRIVEKPQVPPSSLAVIGVYAFRPEVFDVIDGLEPSARGEYEIADAINGIIALERAVSATLTEDYWIDTGKMEDMLAANRAVLSTFRSETSPEATVSASRTNGVVVIDRDAIVEDCELIGPVVIGAGARVTNSHIGPNVAIGVGGTVGSSRISNAIVMESSAIEDSPGIRDSMIGRFARVCRAPDGSRLTLGDHSVFEGPP
jgi:glucose-1-phosphate thymidylyltransferase